ncbi:metallophosphoesterase [Motilimonas sp. E26]|uniref:metallophosphoesterase n=1 Tax=Motilimonas sp. E26 TaxID=2865674 RepID=UPI001E561952|nr:metallophosphoesterase [Motilimonas sp. E26]MCE0557301.1 metallophosphoesterase [Motilimonas sp. E26]
MHFQHQFIDLSDKRKVFAIGDIHGKLEPLKHALTQVQFDPTQDALISVGDLIDRGPDSPNTLHYFASQPWFYAVAGNHELMMSNALKVWWHAKRDDTQQRYIDIWFRNGGDWARNQDDDELRALLEIVEALPCVITCQVRHNKTIGFAHAQPHTLNWQEMQTWQGNMLDNPRWIWGRTRIKGEPNNPITGVDFTVHGHTMSEKAVCVANSYFIDTASYNDYQGAFTLLELNSEQLSTITQLKIIKINRK